MKIRNGFVSNSSSSSFVVLLPDNFLENVDYDEITNNDEDFPVDDLKSLLEEFVKRGVIWNEEIYNYDNEFADILYELVEPYIIASMDTGPDEGQIIIADKNKIKEILAS